MMGDTAAQDYYDPATGLKLASAPPPMGATFDERWPGFADRWPTDNWTLPQRGGQPFGELRAADVPPSQEARWAMQNALVAGGAQPYNAGRLADIADMGLGFTPAGSAISAADAKYDIERGNYGRAAVDVLGALPGVGGLVKMGRALGPVGRAAVGTGVGMGALFQPDTAEAAGISRFIAPVKTLFSPGAYENALSSVKQRIPLSELDQGRRFRPDAMGNLFSRPEDLEIGGNILSLHGDRSASGNVERMLGRNLLGTNYIPGGRGYIERPGPEVWASEPAVAARYQNRIGEFGTQGPVYGLYGPMGVQSIDFQPALANTALTEFRRDRGNITQDAIDSFNAFMKREVVSGKGEKQKIEWPGYEDWPGIENTRDAKTFLADQTGKARDKFMKTLDTAEMMDAGMPNASAIRHAYTDPTVANLPNYSYGRGVALLQPEQIAGYKHPAFGRNIAGENLGGWGYAVPREVAFPNVVQGLQAHDYPVSQWDFFFGGRMPKKVPYVQPVTNDWVAANEAFGQQVKKYGEQGAFEKFGREGLTYTGE